MNFFQSQHVARRNTRVMLGLFLVALVAIVVAIDMVVSVVWLFAADTPAATRAAGRTWGFVPLWVHATTMLVTALIILAVSSWNILMLRSGGGAAVAKMVGARQVLPSTRDLLERRLRNVVEEMALAAGTRVPTVYVMDDEGGVNAFAAGYDPSNAVIAVTRGTLETLNRDELQAVVGHEFSHIVNGDMALNIRMIGVLAGIVFLGAVGGFILRNAEGDGKAAATLAAIGGSILAIGYIGVFFARIIKAMISRQREYLADAASVQFTRNPDAIAGALDQIRTSGRTSLVTNRHAEDVSHLFFGEGLAMKLEWLFATHPPIEERIKRVNPHFEFTGYRKARPVAGDTTQETPAATVVPEAALVLGVAPLAAPPAAAEAPELRAGDREQAWTRSSNESAGLFGVLDNDKVATARRILAAIPQSIQERVRQPDGAAATLIAMLLAPKDTVMDEQLMAAKTAGVGRLAAAAGAIAREMNALSPNYYLPVIDLALPALKLMTKESRRDVLTALQAVIHADRRVSMFEFVLFNLVHTQLEPRTIEHTVRYGSLEAARKDVEFLLSLVGWAGCRRGPQADQQFEAAFRAGAKEMGLADAKPVGRGLLGMEAAGEALRRLRDLAPRPKALLIKGLFAAVTADGCIRVIEAALMRVVSGILDCPLPPLLEELDPDKLAL